MSHVIRMLTLLAPLTLTMLAFSTGIGAPAQACPEASYAEGYVIFVPTPAVA